MLPGEIKNIRVVDVLNEISRLIPDTIDVELTQTVIADDTIQIAGETDSFNSVDSMQSHLEESALFKKVTISNTSKKKIGNAIQFKMRIQLALESEQ
jgi:Tfp pilus assembly protein PilN